MNAGRHLAAVFVAAAAFFYSTQASLARTEVKGPTALIVSYRANPSFRAQFRSVMGSDGVVQFNQWKRGGGASYDALFTAYAASGTPNMFLVLHFNRFTDLECPAFFEPVAMRETGFQGACYGTKEEAHG